MNGWTVKSLAAVVTIHTCTSAHVETKRILIPVGPSHLFVLIDIYYTPTNHLMHAWFN